MTRQGLLWIFLMLKGPDQAAHITFLHWAFWEENLPWGCRFR